MKITSEKHVNALYHYDWKKFYYIEIKKTSKLFTNVKVSSLRNFIPKKKYMKHSDHRRKFC